MLRNRNNMRYCSFCQKPAEKDRLIVDGPNGVCICNKCVAICQSIFEEEIKDEENEMKVQKVMIDLKKRFGKNAILKGMNLEDGATTIDRNKQIGGHSE